MVNHLKHTFSLNQQSFGLLSSGMKFLRLGELLSVVSTGSCSEHVAFLCILCVSFKLVLVGDFQTISGASGCLSCVHSRTAVHELLH